MADGLLTRPTAAARREPRLLPVPLAARWRLMPWWLRVIVVYAASRVVSTVLLLSMAAVEGPNPWTGAHPNYWEFANIWDGRWYNTIALNGYPSRLPVDEAGHVTENAWAFMPAYPFLVRGLMTLTGGPWPVLAVTASLGFGLGAALLFHRMLAPRLGPSTALFAVALFCFSPVSPLFQLAYAESMGLFLLALGLHLVQGRRYWWLLPVVALLAFTRPSGLAFALMLGLHWLYRFVVRAREPFPARERIAAACATVFSVAAGFTWPLIAALATGDPRAYTDTELAWRSSYIGFTDLVPFSPWFQGGAWWGGWWWGQDAGPPIGILLVGLLIAAFFVALFTPAFRRLGVDLRLWLGSYGLYLLAVFFPQSSTFRLLMPLFPALGVVAEPRSRLYRAAMLVLCVALQLGWLAIAWAIDGYDWTPP